MASVSARPDGLPGCVLELPPMEAALVSALPERVEAVLSNPDANGRVIERLFPASYSDPAEEREHRQLLGASMLDERRAMLAAVRGALAAAPRGPAGLSLSFDPAGLDQFLRFLNDLRLLLSTELGLDRNLDELQVPPGHPDAPRYTLLVYLTGLEALLVDAISGAEDS